MKLLLHEKDSNKVLSAVNKSFGPNRFLLLSPRCCKLHQNHHGNYLWNRTCAGQAHVDVCESDALLLSLLLQQGLLCLMPKSHHKNFEQSKNHPETLCIQLRWQKWLIKPNRASCAASAQRSWHQRYLSIENPTSFQSFQASDWD